MMTLTSLRAASGELEAWLVLRILHCIQRTCIPSSGLDGYFVTHSSVHEVVFFNAGKGIFSDVGTCCEIKQRSRLLLPLI